MRLWWWRRIRPAERVSGVSEAIWREGEPRPCRKVSKKGVEVETAIPPICDTGPYRWHDPSRIPAH